MNNDAPLITCQSVGKKFCRDLKKSLWYGLQDSAGDLFGTTKSQISQPNNEEKLRKGEFWAVHDVSFQVRRGECLGLLGRNGAGKTTLLKMINGLIKPDSGSITIRGKVSGLIALGAGFNPILTGRENIYINGSILGMSRRNIDQCFERIVDFAELGDAIDAPVRTYSSGMQVRLGFASAVNLISPDLLLLDEVLAVGDIGFVIKCLNKMRDLASKSAVIFVSHTMPFVSMFCSQALLMANGTVAVHSSNVSDVIEKYNHQFALVDHISGSGDATISLVEFRTVRNDGTTIIGSHIAADHGGPLNLKLVIKTQLECYVEIYLHTVSMVPVVGSKLLNPDNSTLILKPGTHELDVDLGRVDLNAGKYPLMISITETKSKTSLCRTEGNASITIKKESSDWGFLSRSFIARRSTLN